MLSQLAHRVARGIRARGLWGGSDRVAVAVSGGADSVALLLLLAELAPQAEWDLAGVIHVQHGLRGAESDDDEAFCRQMAHRLGLPIDVTPVNVAEARRRMRQSLEATARVLRYQAFEAAAARLGATIVATGHTCDDQAETVLLRLLRGATARGVSAIRPKRGRYVRPLLDCRRVELRRYLADCGEGYREDASNADRSVPRNRLRHEVMPAIEQAWPGGVAALARFAELAADDERWLSTSAAAERPQVIRTGDNGVELISGRLTELAPAVARRVVRDAIEMAGGTPAFREIEAVRRLARATIGRARLDLRGLTAVRVGEGVWLSRPPAEPAATAAFEYRLDVPGEVRIVETGAVIRASFVHGPDRPSSEGGHETVAALQADTVALPLIVRNRRSGDRFTPLGGPGSRTLQNLMVDRKVPRGRRAEVPVVTDAEGRIVWVAGVAVAERCRVRTARSGMVILELTSKKDTL